jgi:hypothetical protein
MLSFPATETHECDDHEINSSDGRPLPDYFTNRTVLEYIRDSMFDALQGKYIIIP